MNEIQPGLLHWTAYHEGIGRDVHSYFHVPSGTLLDPMEPLAGLDALARHARPQRIVLTNRHHFRHSDRFDCPVLCHEAGLHEFSGGVEGFAFGDVLAPGVRALEIGVLTPEETGVLLEGGAGALALADCITRGPHGDFGFFPDELLGDDPQAVRDGVRAALRRIADEHEFDCLLLAHGAPVRSGARSALRAFAELPTAGGMPG
jgi:hypothetical protein